MGVEQRHALMLLTEPRDLGGERGMVGIEIKAPSLGDFGRVRRSARPIERLAVEGRGWAELRRRLTRIERSAARVAIDVDDRARKFRAEQSCAERFAKMFKWSTPPSAAL